MTNKKWHNALSPWTTLQLVMHSRKPTRCGYRASSGLNIWSEDWLQGFRFLFGRKISWDCMSHVCDYRRKSPGR